MTTSTTPPPVGGVTPEQGSAVEAAHADFLPSFDGGAVAGGASAADTLNLQAGKPPRVYVPTGRQTDAGEVVGTAAVLDAAPMPEPDAEATREFETVPKPSLGQRLRSYNPLAIPGTRLPVLVLGGLLLVNTFDQNVLQLIGPELRAEFGLSVGFIIQLGLVMTLVQQLGALPIGYLVDRVKRVWLVRISALGLVAAGLLKATTGTAGGYVAGEVANGGSHAFLQPAALPLLTDYYPSRARGRAFSVVFMFTMVGPLIAVLLSGFLIARYGWRPVVFVSALIALVVGLLTLLLKEPVRGGVDRLESGASAAVAATEPPPLGFQEAMRAAWAIRTVRLQAYSRLVETFTVSVNVVIGLVLAERFGLDAFQRSGILALTFVGALVGLMVAGPLSEKLLAKRPATIVVAQAGMTFVHAGGLVIQAFAPLLIVFAGTQLVVGALALMFVPIWVTIFSVVVPARVRGLGMQIFTPFAFVGGLIGTQLAGLAESMTPQQALLLFAPFFVVAGMLQLATASVIGSDIRRARAASMAGEASREAKEAGETKMIVCRDVDVAYDDVQILFNVDFDVHEGETVALLGTNGAGKSTLMRAIAGLTQASNGAIFLDGRDVTAMPAHQLAAEGVVFMPGGRAVFPGMTVRDNLTTAGWMYRKDGAYVQERINRVLEFFPRLGERMDIAAGTLSGGEQQMVALGQALLMKPRLLMIDELSLGLAPAIVDQLLTTLREIREQGTTIVLVEQSLNVAATVAERAVFMDKGRVEFDGPIGDLLTRSDLVRAIFMGGAGGSTSTRRRTISSLDEPELVLTGTGLTLSYGGVKALDDVSLTVHAGEVVGIIGPNGAGKTTLFDVLSGTSVLDEGTVLLGETDVTAMPSYARAKLGLSRSFQNARLFPALTVRETIAVALEKRAPKNPLAAALWLPGTRKRERKIFERVDGYIDLLGLNAHADKFVSELSTGSRRAVEVACVMAAEPTVLLLDEPTSGLAQAEIEALGPTLASMTHETGVALVVIEHDLPLITQISDRLVAMELGRVLCDGDPAEVTTDDRVVRSYLSASEDVIHRSGSRVGAVLSALQAEKPEEQGSTT